jgi:predicted RNase H-like HicB family nuclease
MNVPEKYLPVINKPMSPYDFALHERLEKLQEVYPMKNIKYVVYKDGDYYVSQCLNVDVSSFGVTIDEAIMALKEAVTLYFDDDKEFSGYQHIGETLIGEDMIHV